MFVLSSTRASRAWRYPPCVPIRRAWAARDVGGARAALVILSPPLTLSKLQRPHEGPRRLEGTCQPPFAAICRPSYPSQSDMLHRVWGARAVRGAPAALAVIFHSSLPTPQATIESFFCYQVAPAQPCFKPSRDTFLFSSSLACAPAASGPAHCTSRLSTACPSSQTLASAPCHTRACTSCRWSRRRSVPLH